MQTQSSRHKAASHAVCLLHHIPFDLTPDKLLPKETASRMARMILMREAPRKERSMEVLCEWIGQADRDLSMREVAWMHENLFMGYLDFAWKMNRAWMRSASGACPTHPKAIASTLFKLFKAGLAGG